jgi:hypothetical protein
LGGDILKAQVRIFLLYCKEFREIFVYFQLLASGINYAFTCMKTKKGGKRMKTRRADKMSFIGAGAGLTLFAVFGLLPGAFVGGFMGIQTAGYLFGLPLGTALLPRIIVAIGMLLGVMGTGLLFTLGGTTLGWLSGLVLDLFSRPEAIEHDEHAHVKH